MLQVAVGFSDIFVPLLLAMSRYAGVTRYEKIQSDTPGGYSSGGLKKKSASGSSDAKKEKLLPYEVACNAMQSFLTCKGCTSVANVVASSNKDFSNEYYEATRTTDFAEVASKSEHSYSLFSVGLL